MMMQLKLYWTVIRPTVVYDCDTWVFKESIIQKLSVFEREILRKIFGPTKQKDGTWKIKTNVELDNLIQHLNTVRCYVPKTELVRTHTQNAQNQYCKENI
jgi:hypothetical protein